MPLAPAAKAEMQLNLKKMRSDKISRYFLQHRYKIYDKSLQLPVCSAGCKNKLRGLLDEEARTAVDRITTRKAAKDFLETRGCIRSPGVYLGIYDHNRKVNKHINFTTHNVEFHGKTTEASRG
jgi:hypothetical protein